MFKELAPLLQQRSTVIMVNSLEGNKLSVGIFPKRLNDAENAALSTPVSLTGTPEELDEQLPSTLTEFVGAHLELKNTLDLAKEEMDRAAKAAKQDSKSKSAGKPEVATAKTTTPGEKKAATQPAKPAPVKTPSPPSTANLFDFGGTPALAPTPLEASAPTEAQDGAEVSAEKEDEEEEILSELAEEGDSEEELDPAA